MENDLIRFMEKISIADTLTLINILMNIMKSTMIHLLCYKSISARNNNKSTKARVDWDNDISNVLQWHLDAEIKRLNYYLHSSAEPNQQYHNSTIHVSR